MQSFKHYWWLCTKLLDIDALKNLTKYRHRCYILMTTLSLAILGNLLRRSSLSLRKIKLTVSFLVPFSKFHHLFFVGQWRTYHLVHLLPRPDSSIPQILLQTSRHIIQECLMSHPTLPLLPRLFNLHMLPRMDLLLHHPFSLLIALQLFRGFSRL